jgi:hypothetical protein
VPLTSQDRRKCCRDAALEVQVLGAVSSEQLVVGVSDAVAHLVPGPVHNHQRAAENVDGVAVLVTVPVMAIGVAIAVVAPMLAVMVSVLAVMVPVLAMVVPVLGIVISILIVVVSVIAVVVLGMIGMVRMVRVIRSRRMRSAVVAAHRVCRYVMLAR